MEAGTLTTVAGVASAASGILGNLQSLVSITPLLGPQSGLQVTPVVFQSIEQEGRWKPVSLVDQDHSPGRNFELNQQIANAANPSQAAFYRSQLTPELWGTVSQSRNTLFTVSCSSLLRGPSSFSVDATWWADGLEIWGGYAGLSQAQGFRDVLDDMAAASLYAAPFGNYYPARMLIGWSGWVNPVGENYFDFRGAIVLSADGTLAGSGSSGASLTPVKISTPTNSSGSSQLTSLPAFMQYWARDGSDPKNVSWDNQSGFSLDAS